MNSTNDGVIPHDAAGGESVGAFAIEVLVIASALIACILRFYTRFMTRAGLGWDDWLICVAVITTLATAALLLAGDSINPNGAWIANNSSPDYVYTDADQMYLKLSFISAVIYFTISATTKIGILCMYQRVFSCNKTFRRSMYAVGFLVLGWWLSSTIGILTSCVPIEWSWLRGAPDPRYCFNVNVFWMASGAVEVLLDTMILALPIRVVLNLQLSKKKKISITAIFLLGGFTVVTGIVRVIFGYIPGSHSLDLSRAEVWTTVHTGMAIICACLPVYWPLVRQIRDSKFGARLLKVFAPCLCCGSSRSRNGRYMPAAYSHERSTSYNGAEKGNVSLVKGQAIHSDSRDLHTSSSSWKSLLTADQQQDLETMPQPAWQSPAAKERVYKTPGISRIPSFVRLTLNLDDVPMELETIRRQSQLLPQHD